MSPPQKKPENPEKTGTSTHTSVDLGEDLLNEPSSISIGPAEGDESGSAQASPLLDSGDDPFENIRILLHEGLRDEAKKILRKILISEPAHVLARETLRNVQEEELKELLNSENFRSATIRSFGIETRRTGEVEKELEALLRGQSDESGDARIEELLRTQMGKQLSGESGKAWIDFGIACKTMGLQNLAKQLFFKAVSTGASWQVQATCLYSDTCMELGEFHEAAEALEQSAFSAGLEQRGESERVELYYLSGKVQQALESWENALNWFLKAGSLDRTYRDVGERIRHCKTMLKRGTQGTRGQGIQ